MSIFYISMHIFKKQTKLGYIICIKSRRDLRYLISRRNRVIVSICHQCIVGFLIRVWGVSQICLLCDECLAYSLGRFSFLALSRIVPHFITVNIWSYNKFLDFDSFLYFFLYLSLSAFELFLDKFSLLLDLPFFLKLLTTSASSCFTSISVLSLSESALEFVSDFNFDESFSDSIYLTFPLY